VWPGWKRSPDQATVFLAWQALVLVVVLAILALAENRARSISLVAAAIIRNTTICLTRTISLKLGIVAPVASSGISYPFFLNLLHFRLVVVVVVVAWLLQLPSFPFLGFFFIRSFRCIVDLSP
jgi:hypothetical protein